ncbi:MAG: HAD-IIIC family phosphatase [bacterium]
MNGKVENILRQSQQNKMSWREEIIGCLDKGEHSKAMAALLEGLPAQPSIAESNFVHQIINRFDFSELNFTAVRVALLGSFTLEPLIPLLKTKALQSGINISEYLAGFNKWLLEPTQADSSLYASEPQVVFLIIRPEDICPSLVFSFMSLSGEEKEQAISQVEQDIRSVLETLRARSRAKIVVTNLPVPAYPALGILDYQHGAGQTSLFRQLNMRLIALVDKIESAWILDWESLQARIGQQAWFDRTKWSAARAPLSFQAMQILTQEMMKFLRAALGLNKKCLVLDLDNTLWGGILGEDGPDGIQLGPEYPEKAFMEFQQAILELYHKGIILAVNSKNNSADVLPVLEKHPHMLLRPNHFAVMKINWQPKVQNMREIADELNIGLDSMVFVDDSAFECEMMKEMLPQVMTVQLGPDPLTYAPALQKLGVFDSLTFSEEDKLRGQLYQAQVARKKLMQECTSQEDFYRSLNMEITLQRVKPPTLKRAAQLTQRTNQFNLTTQRYSEAEIEHFLHAPDYEVFVLKLIDRFGDNGIVGLAILQREITEVIIDTFLLSCRVIGRKVETAFLTFLLHKAKQDEAEAVIGLYRRTKKNGQVANFYQQHGFELLEEGQDIYKWRLPRERFFYTYPDCFKMNIEMEEAVYA